MTKPQTKTVFAAPAQDKLFGVSAVAREIGTSEETVRRLADDGALTHVRDNVGRRLFKRGDIDKFKATRQP